MAKRGRWRPKKVSTMGKFQAFLAWIIPHAKNINYTKVGIQLFLFLFATLFSVFTVLYVVRFLSIEAPAFPLFAWSDVSESHISLFESQKVSNEERQLVLYNWEDIALDWEDANVSTTETVIDETSAWETPEIYETMIRDMYFWLRYGMYDVYVEKFSDRIRRSFTFKTYFNQERILGFVQATNNTLVVSWISKEENTIRYTLSYTYEWQQYSELWRVQLDKDNKIDLINCDNDGCSFMPFFKYIQW